MGIMKSRYLEMSKLKSYQKRQKQYSNCQLLELKNTEFYIYKPKQERNFKVVLKNMHPSTEIAEIKTALGELSHTTNNIWNIKQRITKKSLPIFIIELKPNNNNKDIYEIKSLLHCRITFEPPRPKRDIPQCTNCQHWQWTHKSVL